jgi:hypothetical protein
MTISLLASCTVTPVPQPESPIAPDHDSESHRYKIWSLEEKHAKAEEVIALLGEPDRKEKFPETGEEDWIYWSQVKEFRNGVLTGTKNSDLIAIFSITKDKTVFLLVILRTVYPVGRRKIVDRIKKDKIPPEILSFYRISKGLIYPWSQSDLETIGQLSNQPQFILRLNDHQIYHRDLESYRSKIRSPGVKNSKAENVVVLLGEPDRKEKFPETGREDWFYWSQVGEFKDGVDTGMKKRDVLNVLHIAKDMTVYSITTNMEIHNERREKMVDRTKKNKIPLELLDSYRFHENSTYPSKTLSDTADIYIHPGGSGPSEGFILLSISRPSDKPSINDSQKTSEQPVHKDILALVFSVLVMLVWRFRR